MVSALSVGIVRGADGADGALGHVRIDTAAKTVEIDTTVALTQGDLELLLCLTGTKEHESILVSDAKPSHVHAALLSLGLAPGRPGQWLSSANAEPIYLAPAGPSVEISLRYASAGAGVQTVPADQWIRSENHPAGARKLRWVFAGSTFLNTRGYPADQSGETIALANFPNAVLDVPFASSDSAAELAFAANTQAIPPVGSPVTVVLKPTANNDADAVARAQFDLDDFGRTWMDGMEIHFDQISIWADSFSAQGAQSYVAIRTAPTTTAFDLRRLQDILNPTGVDNLDIMAEAVDGNLFPGATQPAPAALLWWADPFGSPADFRTDGEAQADAIGRQLAWRRRDLSNMLKAFDDQRNGLVDWAKAYRNAAALESGE